MRKTDYKNQLVDYFKKNLNKGYTSESLKFALMSQGYPRTAITEAWDQANKELSVTVPKFREKPKIEYQVLDEHNKPFKRRSFWKRLFGIK